MIPIWIMMPLMLVGVASGITNSLFGFGGGFVVVPAMYWTMRSLGNLPEQICMKIAVSTALMALSVNTIHCVMRLHADKKIDWTRVVDYLLPIALGAMITSFTSQKLPGEIIRKLFALYLFIAIVINIQKKSIQTSTKSSWLWIYPFGMFVGSFASLVGVGGSVFTVSHFRRQGLQMQHCVPIAVTLVLPVSIIGTLSYIWAGWGEAAQLQLPQYSLGYLNLPAVMPIVLGGYLGIEIGIFLVRWIPERLYVQCYIALLTISFIAMIIK
ncbi:MAG: sulfite exporter TauE/SafE family protein [Myxococcota bacterium]